MACSRTCSGWTTKTCRSVARIVLDGPRDHRQAVDGNQRFRERVADVGEALSQTGHGYDKLHCGKTLNDAMRKAC